MCRSRQLRAPPSSSHLYSISVTRPSSSASVSLPVSACAFGFRLKLRRRGLPLSLGIPLQFAARESTFLPNLQHPARHVCRCPSDVANRCERSWHMDWWCPYWESRDWNPSEWCHIGRRFFRLGRELTNVTVNGRPAREILDFDEQCVRCGSWNVEWHTVGLGFGGECLSCRAIQP